MFIQLYRKVASVKLITLGVVVATLGVARVEGSLAPGSAVGPAFGSAPPFLLLAPQGDRAFSTPLPFSVVAGDVVILQSSTAGIGTGNWREVLSFSDVGGHGIATLNVKQDFTGFVLAGQKTGEVEYLVESGGNPVTTYTPDTAALSPQTPSSATYYVNGEVVTPVPEPSSWIAGALLLLPFGLGAARSTRKPR